MSINRESWRWVPGYEGLYLVSDLGNVFSIPRNTSNGGLLSQRLSADGYPVVTLSKNGKTKRVLVHRLVSEAFLGDHSDDMQVNHKDGVRTNNNVGNLEWCTREENVMHELYQLGSIYKRRKLSDDDVREIRKSHESGYKLASDYGVSQSTIQAVRTRKLYKEVA